MTKTEDIIVWPSDLDYDDAPFLAGIPFVGCQHGILKNAGKILSERTNESFICAWSLSGHKLCKVARFCHAIKAYTHDWTEWPNCYYLPNDNARILLGYIPGVAVDPEDVVIPLCRSYGVGLTCAYGIFLELYKANMTIEHLFMRIANNSCDDGALSAQKPSKFVFRRILGEISCLVGFTLWIFGCFCMANAFLIKSECDSIFSKCIVGFFWVLLGRAIRLAGIKKRDLAHEKLRVLIGKNRVRTYDIIIHSVFVIVQLLILVFYVLLAVKKFICYVECNPIQASQTKYMRQSQGGHCG